MIIKPGSLIKVKDPSRFMAKEEYGIVLECWSSRWFWVLLGATKTAILTDEMDVIKE